MNFLKKVKKEVEKRPFYALLSGFCPRFLLWMVIKNLNDTQRYHNSTRHSLIIKLIFYENGVLKFQMLFK
jgi:hypothetical protein